MHPDKEALRQAAEVLGGQAAMAFLLGYKSRGNVSPWFRTDQPIMKEHCPAIERETGKLGKAVHCEQLRRDLAWLRVPDPDWPWHPDGRPVLDITRSDAAVRQPAREAAHAA